jgi:hypothetical protein
VRKGIFFNEGVGADGFEQFLLVNETYEHSEHTQSFWFQCDALASAGDAEVCLTQRIRGTGSWA